MHDNSASHGGVPLHTVTSIIKPGTRQDAKIRIARGIVGITGPQAAGTPRLLESGSVRNFPTSVSALNSSSLECPFFTSTALLSSGAFAPRSHKTYSAIPAAAVSTAQPPSVKRFVHHGATADKANVSRTRREAWQTGGVTT